MKIILKSVLILHFCFLGPVTVFAAEPHDSVYASGINAIEKLVARQKWLRQQIEILSKKDSENVNDRIALEVEADELRKLLDKDLNCNVWIEAMKRAHDLNDLEVDIEHERLYAQENYATLKAAFAACGLLTVAGAVVFTNWFFGIKKERDIYFGIPKL